MTSARHVQTSTKEPLWRASTGKVTHATPKSSDHSTDPTTRSKSKTPTTSPSFTAETSPEAAGSEAERLVAVALKFPVPESRPSFSQAFGISRMPTPEPPETATSRPLCSEA